MILKLTPAWAPILVALWFLFSARAPKSEPGAMEVHEFGRIPISYNGRVKPADTFARNMLRIASDRESFVDAEYKRQPAIVWLLDLLADGGRAEKHKVFRIYHPQLLVALGLSEREGFRYSVEEFGKRIPDILPHLKEASRKKREKADLDAYEQQLLKLEQRLMPFQMIQESHIPLLVPPSASSDWQSLRQATGQVSAAPSPYVESWTKILRAYSAKDAAGFNAAVKAHLARVGAEFPTEVRKAGFESHFNHFDGFSKCQWLYLLAFVVGCLAWLGSAHVLNRTAWNLIGVAFVVHTFALVARMYLSGRPPVTNLYSSAIFIGWASVGLGLVLERFYRYGVGNAVAAIAGFVTLEIAYVLSADGDTMEVLQAVLDTQFWLATHVVCITLGYATTYVAGLIGIFVVLRGVLTTSLSPEIARNMSRMIYGVTCFSMFFSFVGTVLGGLWADDSWGRFWGWDPKENGALMIVLWNALILHARWGGIARERGLALLAVFGNIVVSWSWFGVNLLGKGLHAYGFIEGFDTRLWIFVWSQVTIILLGLGVPPEKWRSPLPVKGAHAEVR